MAEQIMAKAEYLSSLHQRQISVLINKNRAQQDFICLQQPQLIIFFFLSCFYKHLDMHKVIPATSDLRT